MKIRYEKQAVKTLVKIQPKLAKAIQAKIEEFVANGAKSNVDIKPLHGTLSGFRLRQGSWRALMYIHGDELIVHAIKPRGDAYK
jgi:mRNA-degrading endonuclease RelE of RelBE toxin-antitoxin system